MPWFQNNDNEEKWSGPRRELHNDINELQKSYEKTKSNNQRILQERQNQMLKDVRNKKAQHDTEIDKLRADGNENIMKAQNEINSDETSRQAAHDLQMKHGRYAIDRQRGLHTKIADEEHATWRKMEEQRRITNEDYQKNHSALWRNYERTTKELTDQLFKAKKEEFVNQLKRTELECAERLKGARTAADIVEQNRLELIYQQHYEMFLDVGKCAQGLIESVNMLATFVENVDEDDMDLVNLYNQEFNTSNRIVYEKIDILDRFLRNCMLTSLHFRRDLLTPFAIFQRYRLDSLAVYEKLNHARRKSDVETIRGTKFMLGEYEHAVKRVIDDMSTINGLEYVQEALQQRRSRPLGY